MVYKKGTPKIQGLWKIQGLRTGIPLLPHTLWAKTSTSSAQIQGCGKSTPLPDGRVTNSHCKSMNEGKELELSLQSFFTRSLVWSMRYGWQVFSAKVQTVTILVYVGCNHFLLFLLFIFVFIFITFFFNPLNMSKHSVLNICTKRLQAWFGL